MAFDDALAAASSMQELWWCRERVAAAVQAGLRCPLPMSGLPVQYMFQSCRWLSDAPRNARATNTGERSELMEAAKGAAREYVAWYGDAVADTVGHAMAAQDALDLEVRVHTGVRERVSAVAVGGGGCVTERALSGRRARGSGGECTEARAGGGCGR